MSICHKTDFFKKYLTDRVFGNAGAIEQPTRLWLTAHQGTIPEAHVVGLEYFLAEAQRLGQPIEASFNPHPLSPSVALSNPLFFQVPSTEKNTVIDYFVLWGEFALGPEDVKPFYILEGEGGEYSFDLNQGVNFTVQVYEVNKLYDLRTNITEYFFLRLPDARLYQAESFAVSFHHINHFDRLSQDLGLGKLYRVVENQNLVFEPLYSYLRVPPLLLFDNRYNYTISLPNFTVDDRYWAIGEADSFTPYFSNPFAEDDPHHLKILWGLFNEDSSPPEQNPNGPPEQNQGSPPEPFAIQIFARTNPSPDDIIKAGTTIQRREKITDPTFYTEYLS